MKKIIYLSVLIAAFVITLALSGCGNPPTSGKKGGVHPPATVQDTGKKSDTSKGTTNAVQAPAKEALIFVLGFTLCGLGGYYVRKRFRPDLNSIRIAN